MLTVEKVKEVLEVGMKFSTRAGLVRMIGLSKVTNKEDIGRQDEEIARFLEYKKTGKLNRQGKESNEIVITKIREVPLEKVDGRSTNTFADGTRYAQESYFKEHLKEAILDYLTNKEPIFDGSVYKLLGAEEIITRNFFREHKGDLTRTYLGCAGSKIYKPFTSALKELQEENTIKYDKVLLFRFAKEDEEYLLTDEIKPLYEEAYAYAEDETGLKPFKRYSYILGCINKFKEKLIWYMNEHGNFDKVLINYRNPFVIEKGDNFTSFNMTVDSKKTFMENIHRQVSISKTMQDAKDRIEKFGEAREKYFTNTLENIRKAMFYIEEIKQAERIEKKIKFHSLHSDLYIAIREINELNAEYREIMKKDSILALEFLANIEADSFYRELERYDEEVEEEFTTFEYPIKSIVKSLVGIDEDLDYNVWMAQSR